MQKKKILITGVAGFIGFALAEKLIKNNFHFSSKSVILNNKMPMFTFNCISEKFKSLNNKKVLFLGN